MFVEKRGRKTIPRSSTRRSLKRRLRAAVRRRWAKAGKKERYARAVP
jgi:hypothetical protein